MSSHLWSGIAPARDSGHSQQKLKLWIKSIYRRRFDVDKKIAERRSDREEVLSRLRILHEREKRLKYDMAWRKKPQEHLQLALDRLSFANSAYQDR
uniref:Uncharacterized protein n=1 Tax=Salix viminalis TaxID=40686 RepID=A0A6N2NCM9_SALVM